MMKKIKLVSLRPTGSARYEGRAKRSNLLRDCFVALLLAMTLTPAWAGIDDGLVGYWNFDEGAGTATLLNGPTFGVGQKGNALNLDGVNDKAKVDASTALNSLIAGGTAAISMWVKHSSLSQLHQSYFAFYGPVDNNSYYFQIHRITAEGKIAFEQKVNGTNYYNASSGNIITDTNWHMLTFVFTGTQVKIYLDGKPSETVTLRAVLSSQPAGSRLVLGSFSPVWNDYPFKGSMDDVRLYNRVLTNAEVQDLYVFAGGVIDDSEAEDPYIEPEPDVLPTMTGRIYNTVPIVCSTTEVQKAINAAQPGDTILVAEGNCTWDQQVVVTKRLWLKGSGIGKTVIIRDASYAALNLRRTGSRVSGFTFKLLTNHDSIGIEVDGNSWRIDHNRFESVAGKYPVGVIVRAQTMGQTPRGVIDHCDFIDTMSLVAPGNIMNHASWADDTNLGSDQAAFVEDSVFKFTGFGEAIDSNYGGRLVFRHNTVTDLLIGIHSVQGANRAARTWEFYDNTFISTHPEDNFVFQIRGGTGVIYNNTLIGKWRNPIIFDNVRDFDDRFDAANKCGGASSLDGNEALESGGQGQHTGANGSSVLQTNGSLWSAGAFVRSSSESGTWNTHWVWNLTDGSKGVITANTNNTVSAVLSGGTRNTWNAGDQFKISDGYPCRDQIGRSKDQFLATSNNPNPPQKLDPVYLWNNKMKSSVNDTGVDVGVVAGSKHIKKDRDYFLNTSRGGYTPYTYPHPLTDESYWNPKIEDTAAIIPQDRRIDWSASGIPGGVPNRTTICANVKNSPYNAKGDGINNDTAAIQNAINACPSGRVVYLPAGNYITTGISLKSGITLRGEGPSLTTLTGNIHFTGGRWFDEFADVESGYTKGSTKITLKTLPPNLKVGMHIIVDQLNDGQLVDPVGVEGKCTYCSRDSGNRILGQMIEVKNISGKDIAFEPALNWNYSSNLIPQVFYAVDLSTPTANTIRNAGLEDLKVSTHSYHSIDLMRASYCWIKNVESEAAGIAHVRFTSVFRSEIRDSYFHDISGSANSTGQGYGLLLEYQSTSNLIENNILARNRGAILIDAGSNANVISYNFVTEPLFYSQALGADLVQHAAHPFMNLWEGNIAAKFYADPYHGSSSHNTLFRNRLYGTKANTPGSNRAIQIDQKSLYYNVVGNVLGVSGWSGGYECSSPGDSCTSSPIIYKLGYLSDGDGNPSTGDARVKQSLFRHGNYDYATKSIVWDSTNTERALPASFYLQAKPLWWIENLSWPAFGPDPTDSLKLLNGKIPSQIRYEAIQGIATGDVSGDGKVTMYDAALVLRFTLGSNLTDVQKQKADMNADGKIDGADVVAIARKGLGL